MKRFYHWLWIGLAGCSSFMGQPPKGAEDAVDADESAAIHALGAKASGIVVWSSSRVGNHDLYTMRTDGSDVRQITRGDDVDWFPRFSPDGTKILFCRSKHGWVSERDANDTDKWDVYTVDVDGSHPVKVVDRGSWASWVGPSKIIFVRGTNILEKQLPDGPESVLMSSAGTPDLDGALLQQPELSHDGAYIAITLRGSKRETGIWNIADRRWQPTGLGCQINWTPDQSSVYWVNPTGNGGSQLFRMPIVAGKANQDFSEDDLRFMDLPGRRSHEYFPQLSADGKWLVWGATQRGHDHDIADYEIYLWELGTKPESAVRLTHNSGNDRWPDIYIPLAKVAR
jgi:Tol biopolymer transport system component